MGAQPHFDASTDLRSILHANPSFCKQTSNVSSTVQTQTFKSLYYKFMKSYIWGGMLFIVLGGLALAYQGFASLIKKKFLISGRFMPLQKNAIAFLFPRYSEGLRW